MAIFSNHATLTYNGNSTNSNVAYGEILDVLTLTKTSIEGSYTPGSVVTYAVTLRNTGNTALNGLILTDDLGGYALADGTTVYPLDYVNDSVALFIDGVLQPSPVVTLGPPLVFSGINIPGGSDAVLIYQARTNAFASPNTDGTIVNTVSATGDGLSAPIVASETVTAEQAPLLTISKCITPSQVVDNDRVTYTFVIQNSGNQPIVATDDAAVSDIFNPILTALSVTFEGSVWTEGVQYNYDDITGLFATVPGQIVVPAATFTQDPITGAYTTVPGTATLIVTGTI